MFGLRWLREKSFIAAILAGYSLAAAGQAARADLPADCSGYASVPLPADSEKVATPVTYPGCASYRSYRGIGRPIDYAAARTCAWQEWRAQEAKLRQNPDEPTAWVVGGSLILADLYFNGAGVERNVPLSLRFACELDEGTASLALKEIAKVGASASSRRPFEFCDYAATTFMMNFCSEYASEIENDRRSRYYKSVEASMTEGQRAAFEKLLTAQDTYIEAHALEVDQGGTIHGIRTLTSQGILRKLFRSEVAHYERKEWPVLSSEQIASADAVLDREFEMKVRQLQAQSSDAIQGGAVTAPGLSRAEEAWKKYREAWAAFARLRYPEAASAIGAEITLDRYRVLKRIP